MGPGAVTGAPGAGAAPSALAPPPQAKWGQTTTTTADDQVAYHTRLLNHTITTSTNTVVMSHQVDQIHAVVEKDRMGNETAANQVVAQPVNQAHSACFMERKFSNNCKKIQHVATSTTGKKVLFVDLCDGGD